MTRRLLLSYLSVTVLVLLVLEIPLAVFYQRWERERLVAGLAGDASVLATRYEDTLELGPATPDTVDVGLALDYQADTGARVVLVDAAGRSLLDTEQPADRNLSTRPEIAAALQGERTSGTRYSTTLGTDLLFVSVPVASGGRVYGALRLSLDTAELDAHVRRFQLGLAAVAVVVLAMMTMVGWIIARSVTSPVTRLRRTAERYAQGDLSAGDALDEDAPEELRALGDTMSTMAVRLDGVLAEQRAFVADASHQLRTPLTALRLRLENLQQRSAAGDSAELEAAIEEADRLSALVNDLLALARAERARPTITVRLADLVADRVDTWGAVADAHDVHLALSVDPAGRGGAPAEAVPGAVEQILDNVLDNAVAASPPGSTVTVAVRHEDRHWCLVVADEGPGLDDDEKVKALRRFWRGDLSRPGTGLGLAIAAGLASASGATLTLEDNTGIDRNGPAGGGERLRVVLRLRAATEPPAARPTSPDQRSAYTS
ncbi:MAG: histidine kinase dimerization/phospho-acceptor domain-containing protein [Acidimicrobiales bacterium]